MSAEKPAGNIAKNIVNGGQLNVGNPGNKGGGRPPEEFRRECGEKLGVWLERSASLLQQLHDKATQSEDDDLRLKVVDASGKLAERFGKYTGLEKLAVDHTNDGKAFDPITVYLPSNGREDSQN